MSKDSGELGNTMMNDFSQIEEGVTHILRSLSVVSSSHFWLCSEWLLLIGVWHWLCLPDFL